jgi:phycocyanin alpha chain
LRVIVACADARGEFLNAGPIDALPVQRIHTLVALSRHGSWYVEALTYIKNNHGISGDSGVIANNYIDYAINALV